MKRIIFSLLPAIVLVGCKTAPQNQPAHPHPQPHATQSASSYSATPPPRASTNGAYVFGWGFQPDRLASPRGGTSRGGTIKLAPAVATKSKPGASALDRDRAAILAMAGDFKTSFHFMETLSLAENYTNTRPYHSWATEHVRGLEDKGEFISLQHTLVMFFADKDGKESRPMLTKHWRQDWAYQDTDWHQFKGNNTWGREKRAPESVKGAWSQAVYHVDDSPRYTAVGKWEHSGGASRWLSETDWRPLPRREFSVRKDYNVLEGRHQIVITPTGWVHEQDNWKRVAGDSSPNAEFLAQEWGINRYERITAPSLASADEYWKKTAPYWAAVRAVWKDIFAKRDRVKLNTNMAGEELYIPHFMFAEEMAGGTARTIAECEAHARETIEKFLAK